MSITENKLKQVKKIFPNSYLRWNENERKDIIIDNGTCYLKICYWGCFQLGTLEKTFMGSSKFVDIIKALRAIKRYNKVVGE